MEDKAHKNNKKRVWIWVIAVAILVALLIVFSPRNGRDSDYKPFVFGSGGLQGQVYGAKDATEARFIYETVNSRIKNGNKDMPYWMIRDLEKSMVENPSS